MSKCTQEEISINRCGSPVNLKAAFNSVDREARCLMLHSIEMPAKFSEIIKALCTDTVRCVRVDGCTSDWFNIRAAFNRAVWSRRTYSCPNGLHLGKDSAQGNAWRDVDCILERTVHKGMLGATLGEETFTDPKYADDVALLADMLKILFLSLDVMQQKAKTIRSWNQLVV